MYRYFVSYNVNGSVSGFGNAEITTNRPYTTFDDIVDWQRKIEEEWEYPNGSVIVLNFVLLSSDEAKTEPNT